MQMSWLLWHQKWPAFLRRIKFGFPYGPFKGLGIWVAACNNHSSPVWGSPQFEKLMVCFQEVSFGLQFPVSTTRGCPAPGEPQEPRRAALVRVLSHTQCLEIDGEKRGRGERLVFLYLFVYPCGSGCCCWQQVCLCRFHEKQSSA